MTYFGADDQIVALPSILLDGLAHHDLRLPRRITIPMQSAICRCLPQL
jgi:hypothetical protein